MGSPSERLSDSSDTRNPLKPKRTQKFFKHRRLRSSDFAWGHLKEPSQQGFCCVPYRAQFLGSEALRPKLGCRALAFAFCLSNLAYITSFCDLLVANILCYRRS